MNLSFSFTFTRKVLRGPSDPLSTRTRYSAFDGRVGHAARVRDRISFPNENIYHFSIVYRILTKLCSADV